MPWGKKIFSEYLDIKQIHISYGCNREHDGVDTGTALTETERLVEENDTREATRQRHGDKQCSRGGGLDEEDWSKEDAWWLQENRKEDCK